MPADASSSSGSSGAPSDGGRTEPHRTRPLGSTGSRVFVIGLFLVIVGLAVGQSYYLLSIAESSAEMPADSTEVVAPSSAAEPSPEAKPSPEAEPVPDAAPGDTSEPSTQ